MQVSKNKILTAVESQPVRVYMYSVLVPLVALLVAFGILKSSDIDLILGVASAVLGTGAVEAAHNAVSPVNQVSAPPAVPVAPAPDSPSAT